jgi:calmodulin
MAQQFDQEQLSDLKEAFTTADSNNDGFLTVDELGQALRIMGQNPNAQDLSAMTGIPVSTNPNDPPQGAIPFDRFLQFAAMNSKPAESEEDVIRAFRVFDKDGSGYIMNSDFRRAMTAYGEKMDDDEIDELLREADNEGNGYIQYVPFVKSVFKSFKG